MNLSRHPNPRAGLPSDIDGRMWPLHTRVASDEAHIVAAWPRCPLVPRRIQTMMDDVHMPEADLAASLIVGDRDVMRLLTIPVERRQLLVSGMMDRVHHRRGGREAGTRQRDRRVRVDHVLSLIHISE